jgi:isoleucyl-tRNA synthetase
MSSASQDDEGLFGASPRWLGLSWSARGACTRWPRRLTSGWTPIDTARAGRLLTDFIDDLSNWYVRRSRQRFWEGDQDALVTLYECLDVLTRLAPLVPVITEEVWQHVIRPGNQSAPESVHLATWPEPDAGLINPELSVATARALAEAGRSARKASNVRIRQPLSRALSASPPAPCSFRRCSMT